MQYSADDIVPHNWPEMKKTFDNRWVREWNITFKNPVSDKMTLKSLSETLSYIGHEVFVLKENDFNFKFRVTTNDSNREDYVCFNAYKMLEEIDILCGEINTIQGQPRDSWNPWLRRKTFPSADYKLSRIIIRDVEIGLRISSKKGFSFFGINEVNDLLLKGAKVALINPGGVITQEIESDTNSKKFAFNGFILNVTLEQRESGVQRD